MNNTLYNRLRHTKNKERFDEACKVILSSKSVLAQILKNVVGEFKNFDLDYIRDYCIENEMISNTPLHMHEGEFISGMNVESKTLNEGQVGFDILFTACVPGDKEPIKIFLNIEAQSHIPRYPIPKRGIYGSEFTHSHYDKIKKVYSIWICMNVPKYKCNTIAKYGIMKEDLVGHFHENKSDYDLLELIVINLGKPDDPNYEGLIKMLEILLLNQMTFDKKMSILENEYAIKLTKKEEDEVRERCTWTDAIINIAIEKAELHAEKRIKELTETKVNELAEIKANELAEIKANELAEIKANELAEIKANELAKEKADKIINLHHQETLDQGIEQGKDMQLLNSIQCIMSSLNTSIENAFAILNVSPDKQEHYRKLIQQ